MINKYHLIFLAIFISAGAVYPKFSYILASKVDDLKKQIEIRSQQIKEIEEEIAKYQLQIDIESQKAKTLKSQIGALEATIRKLNADIRLTEKRIDNVELAIEKLNLDIGDTESKIQQRKAGLAETIRLISETESSTFIEILLKNEKLSDFFGILENIENLQKAVRANLEKLKKLKQDLETQEKEKEVQKNDLEKLKGELSDRRTISKNTQIEKSSLLFETKSREATYQKLLLEREKKRAAIDAEIMKIEDELRRLIDPSLLPPPRPGVLGAPLASLIITQGFGLTSFAKNNDSYGASGHNGVDFRASIGMPVFAAEDGVVKATGNSDSVCPGGSYGRWILIEHPNGLTTLYAHLSLIKVVSGAQVKRGVLIGYSGASGYTTGPHLHFTVYASKTVEIRPSRMCGLLPYGGYLDPLNYLVI